jgi:hypothetical protein
MKPTTGQRSRDPQKENSNNNETNREQKEMEMG